MKSIDVDLNKLKNSKPKHEIPPQPKGIYRVESDDGYTYYGRIENMTYNKIFIWNEVTGNFIILRFKDINKMVPIKDYPDRMVKNNEN